MEYANVIDKNLLIYPMINILKKEHNDKLRIIGLRPKKLEV